jgi:hypothetical protein
VSKHSLTRASTGNTCPLHSSSACGCEQSCENMLLRRLQHTTCACLQGDSTSTAANDKLSNNDTCNGYACHWLRYHLPVVHGLQHDVHSIAEGGSLADVGAQQLNKRLQRR